MCTHCKKQFANTSFYLEDGLPYCERDWNELFTTKCVACNFPIAAGDRWVEAINNNYHSTCFRLVIFATAETGLNPVDSLRYLLPILIELPSFSGFQVYAMQPNAGGPEFLREKRSPILQESSLGSQARREQNILTVWLAVQHWNDNLREDKNSTQKNLSKLIATYCFLLNLFRLSCIFRVFCLVNLIVNLFIRSLSPKRLLALQTEFIIEKRCAEFIWGIASGKWLDKKQLLTSLAARTGRVGQNTPIELGQVNHPNFESFADEKQNWILKVLRIQHAFFVLISLHISFVINKGFFTKTTVSLSSGQPCRKIDGPWNHWFNLNLKNHKKNQNQWGKTSAKVLCSLSYFCAWVLGSEWEM